MFAGLFVKADATHQWMVGAWLLVIGLLLGPFLAAKLIQAVMWANAAIGLPRGWLEQARWLRWFFAVTFAVFAAYGATLLALFVAAKTGLIGDLWNR